MTDLFDWPLVDEQSGFPARKLLVADEQLDRDALFALPAAALPRIIDRGPEMPVRAIHLGTFTMW